MRTRPARRSAFRCLETAGCGAPRIRSISPADRSPPRSISRTRRRVGSARAANAVSMTVYMPPIEYAGKRILRARRRKSPDGFGHALVDMLGADQVEQAQPRKGVLGGHRFQSG